jgi:hypothetical protein
VWSQIQTWSLLITVLNLFFTTAKSNENQHYPQVSLKSPPPKQPNSMVQGLPQLLSWSRNSLLLWNPKIQHRFHKSPQLHYILSKYYSIHIHTTHIPKIHFNIIDSRRLQSGQFTRAFPTKTVNAFLISSFICSIL